MQIFLGKRNIIINQRFSVGVLDNYINASFPEITLSLLPLQDYYKNLGSQGQPEEIGESSILMIFTFDL